MIGVLDILTLLVLSQFIHITRPELGTHHLTEKKSDIQRSEIVQVCVALKQALAKQQPADKSASLPVL